MGFKATKPLGEYGTFLEKYRIQKDISLQMFIEGFVRVEDNNRDLTRDLRDFMGIELSSRCSMIMIVSIINIENFGRNAFTIPTVEKTFKKHLGENARVMFFTLANSVGCFLIPNNLTVDDAALLEQELVSELAACAENACAELEGYGIAVSVACSGMKSGLQPKQLFREALVVRDHCGGRGMRVATQADLPPLVQIDRRELAMNERKFMSCVISKDFFGAVTALSTVVDMMIQESRPTVEHIRDSLWTRLETVMTICGMDLHPDRQGKEMTAALTSIITAETFADVKDRIYDFFAVLDDCCGSVDEADKLVKIKEFVSDNYTDPSMGAAMICEHFKFSSSYLSRLFKTQTGGSVVDYIHSVRIASARKLLDSTDMTVNDVSTAVGFANRWTFIRAFRSMENMSPTDYRKLFR